MTQHIYGLEKLRGAVLSLTRYGSQKERLVNAVILNLIHIRPEDNLPEEIIEEFNEFMREITSVEPLGDEGSVQATINSLDETGVDRAIEKIIGFFEEFCRLS